ncbi:hypothetical protein IAD21_02434 [Abditibacteriota bacterium]|nr:hypothetical protein IAD21_02434 [Abditibacteriota bacterium]
MAFELFWALSQREVLLLLAVCFLHLQIPCFDFLAGKAQYPLRFLVGTGFDISAS